MIPTRNRPGYLALTVKSVLQQAREHGHDVQVVISDQSDARQAKHNEKMMRKLEEKYGLPVHYYPPGNLPQLDALLKRATPEQRDAFNALVPKDGQWGAHRNRLSLLAAMHGGQRAAYLHLDDDTPIMQIQKITRSSGRRAHALRPHDHDALENILQAYNEAILQAKPGISVQYIGVRDAATSNRNPGDAQESLKRWLRKPSRLGTAGYGPGRLLRFNATIAPYRPYGHNSDFNHTERIETALNQRLGYYSSRPATLTHIGVKGIAPRPPSQSINPPLDKHASDWMKLARKATRKGRQILHEARERTRAQKRGTAAR